MSNDLKEVFRNELLDEYLKRNPNVKRENVVTRMNNGKIIFETIGHIFEEATKQKHLIQNQKKPSIQLNSIPMHEISRNQDERFQRCMQSIGHGRIYLQFLGEYFRGCLSIDQQCKTENRLTRYESALANEGRAYIEEKHKLCAVLNEAGQNLTSGKARQQVVMLLSHFRTILSTQVRILETELFLSEKSLQTIQHFIAKRYPSAKNKTSIRKQNMVVKAYKTLNLHAAFEAPNLRAETFQELETHLPTIQQNLDSRKETLEALRKVVDFLQNLLDAERMEETAPEAGANRQTTGPSLIQRGMHFLAKKVQRSA